MLERLGIELSPDGKDSMPITNTSCSYICIATSEEKETERKDTLDVESILKPCGDPVQHVTGQNEHTVST